MARLKYLLFFALAATAFAADNPNVSGNWKGSMKIYGGSESAACMSLKQDSHTVTGTAGPCDKSFAITRGIVRGDHVTVEAHPGTPTLKFAMRLSGDKLDGDVFEDEQKIGAISMERSSK